MAYGQTVESRPTLRGGVVRVAGRAASPVPASAPIVRRLVLVSSHGSSASTPLIAVDIDTLQGYEVDDFDGLGFSLGKIVKNVGKAVTKAVVDTGHATGKVVTSTAGKAIIGGALALTGVGLPAAVGIMAASQAGGNLVKKGGNLGKAARGAAEGAAEGAVAGVAGKALKAFAPNVVDAARSKVGLSSFRPQAKTQVIPPPSDSVVAPETVRRRPPSLLRPSSVPLQSVPDLLHTSILPPPPPMVGVDVAAPVPSIIPLGLPDPVSVVKTGTAIVKRATSAMQKVKQGVSDNSDVLNAIERLTQTQQPSQVFTPTGSSSAPDVPAPAAPQQAGMLGGIPPVALAAGAVALLLLTMKRGR